jgi:hypothetical protein
VGLCGFLWAGEPKKYREPEVTKTDRAHWAFQKPKRPGPPRVRHAQPVTNPIDAFLLARLEKAGLDFAPPADRATLLRRVTFDLTGLPPSPEEVEAFLQDRRPGAYARVVERLLASPRYGERWAQHWLDVVRYAESNGYEVDGERPHAWRYRDFVIRALNADMPYDRFLREQVAGDELAEREPQSNKADLLIPSGFNRCGPVHLVSGNVDPEVGRQEVLTEMADAVGSVFLGLTAGCARCHNHKFDPLSQADYYRLRAFFAAAQPRDVDISTPEERKAYEERVRVLRAKLLSLQQQVARLEAPHRKRLTEAKIARLEARYRQALGVAAKKRTPAQKKLAADVELLIKVNWDELLEALTPAERRKRAAWRAQIHALQAQMPPPPAHAWTVRDEKKIPPTYVLVRGDPKKKGIEVQPAFPRVLTLAERGKGNSGKEERAVRLDRIALARWLSQPDHPLTARVMVNRIWQHHFGRGLVATPNDFGTRGEPPTHPELLDWLAGEFVSHGWSVKHVHRLILLSSAYRQAGRAANPAAKRADPDNRLLWHMPRRRVQGEALRDRALAVAGTLNSKMGGPMVRVPLEPEVYDLIFTEGEPDGLWQVTPDWREYGRRSIYLFAKRNVRLPLLEAFDKPDSLTSCPIRPVSTFAPQALILLNGPFMQEQSRRFAGRLLRECGGSRERQIGRAYRLALSRPARPVERKMMREFLTSQAALYRDRLRARQALSVPEDVSKGVDPAEAAALADCCLALLNCNEFLYIN